MVKFETLLALAVGGLAFGTGDLAHFGGGRPWREQDRGLLAVALIQVSYAYSGWNGAAYLAGEIADPQRQCRAA